MIGKHVLEGVGRRVESAEAVAHERGAKCELVHAQSIGGTDALSRP